MSWAVACFVGEEWYPIWEQAAKTLMHKSQDHEHEFPPEIVMGIWEELWSRWCEELRETLRSLLRAMQQPSPSSDRLQFFCRTIGPHGLPMLQFPTAFSLEDPEAYFMKDIMARHQRMLNRACWGMSFRQPQLAPGRAGETDEAPPELSPAWGTGRPSGKAGYDQMGAGAKGEGKGKNDNKGARHSPFPKELDLDPQENARSMDHHPKSSSGQYICTLKLAACGGFMCCLALAVRGAFSPGFILGTI